MCMHRFHCYIIFTISVLSTVNSYAFYLMQADVRPTLELLKNAGIRVRSYHRGVSSVSNSIHYGYMYIPRCGC